MGESEGWSRQYLGSKTSITKRTLKDSRGFWGGGRMKKSLTGQDAQVTDKFDEKV